MYFDDLAPHTYGPPQYRYPNVLAIGWLSNEHPFTTGEVSASFLERLRALERRSWSPYYTMGPHFCEFCPPHTHGGAQEIWVPGERFVYAAPQMVVHYVERHSYKPPDEFIDAVMKCPPMNSPAYFDALRRHGIEGVPIPWPDEE